jgi:hypothetical protein
MEAAATAFANANNGLLPREAAQPTPCLQQAILLPGEVNAEPACRQ